MGRKSIPCKLPSSISIIFRQFLVMHGASRREPSLPQGSSRLAPIPSAWLRRAAFGTLIPSIPSGAAVYWYLLPPPLLSQSLTSAMMPLPTSLFILMQRGQVSASSENRGSEEFYFWNFFELALKRPEDSSIMSFPL